MASKDSDRWPAAFRASILSATIAKHVSYVGLADRRAHILLTINAFLIPLALSVVEKPVFKVGAIVLIIASVLSIIFSVLILLPKKYARQGHEHAHLLHFSEISHMSEEEYLKDMMKAFGKKEEIIKMVSVDLYHLSNSILAPKFRWLRFGYGSFLVGIIAASAVILVNV